MTIFDSPQQLIFQELSSFAVTNGVNLGVKELKRWSERIFQRLNSEIVSHKKAAAMLDISTDLLHLLRNDGLITGTPKNPHAARKHWQYKLIDILDLKAHRTELKNKRN